MADSPENPKGRINPLLDNDDFYTISEPAKPPAVSNLVEKHMRAAERKRISAAEELPPPPRWPMLSGVLSFPFYLNTLGPWMLITFGLMIAAWLLMFWIEYGGIGGMSTVFYIGMPTCLTAILTIGFAASCSFTIIESTSNGWDTFEVSSGMDWKEWVWSFAHITALLMQAGLVGYVVELVSFSDSWLPMIAVTFAVFPLVLLGALAADGAWAPLAIGKVLLSLVQVWWAWGLFYLEITPMAVGWTFLTNMELAGDTPWLAPLYAAPLLATIILIYARLIGRLGGCIAAETAKLSTEGDDDE